MSKKLTTEQLASLTDSAIDKMRTLLYEYRNDESEKYQKRASLLAYWICDYIKYIRAEDDFKPQNLIKYSRGDLIIVNFGYRVGRELGGRHFAVVLDIDNSKFSPSITVIPLTSLKKTTKENKYTYMLEEDLPKLYQQKYDEMIADCFELMNRSTGKETIKKIKEKMAAMSDFDKELKKLKDGSIAQIAQITTISKQRIISPKSTKDGMYGLKISTKDLDEINKKIKGLYIFGNNS